MINQNGREQMSQFSFSLADAKAEQFCWRIVRAMMRFGISKSEALRRLNQAWKGQSVGGKDDGSWIVYHLDADEWAERIFYGTKQVHEARWAGRSLPRMQPRSDKR
jgi:hypothetical protein